MATLATSARQDNLEAIGRWEQTYNGGDIDAFIDGSYAPNADVWFTGASAHGHEQFKRVERGVIEGAPGRYMRVDHIHWIADDHAVVEAVVLDKARPDYFSPFCAILSFGDGLIVQDRTYLDPGAWPGIDKAIPYVTPGGLGSQ